MDRLMTTLRQVLEGYTGEALNGYSYLTENADGVKHTLRINGTDVYDCESHRPLASTTSERTQRSGPSCHQTAPVSSAA